jgi:hypothetical protein
MAADPPDAEVAATGRTTSAPTEKVASPAGEDEPNGPAGEDSQPHDAATSTNETLTRTGDASAGAVNGTGLPSERRTGRRAESVPARILRYAGRLIRKHDSNQDGQLQEKEYSGFLRKPALTDVNGDGILTLAEIAGRVAYYSRNRAVRIIPPASNPLVAENRDGSVATGQPGAEADGSSGSSATNAGAPAERRRDLRFFVPKQRLPKGLPSWFVARDTNGDGQLTLAEFSSSPTSADLQRFGTFDANGDGVITAAECTRSTKRANVKEPPATDTSPR